MIKIKTLPADLQKVAETELGEVPERISDDLKSLRSWIEQQPHLNARLDEQFLIQYLRGCKYNLEKAKRKIDLFFTLKTKFPKFFNNTNVFSEGFRKMNSYGLGTPLPIPLNENGPRLYWIKYDGDVAKGLVDFDELYVVMNCMHEIILMDDPYAYINGIVYIFNLENATLSLAAKYTPTFLLKVVQFYEKSFPFRISGGHAINMPSFGYSVANLMISMLSEKLQKRVSLYGKNYDDIYKIIPKKYFPIEMGGENGSLSQILKDYDKKWLEYENYFKENANYGTNELLRPGKPIDFDTMFGMGGTFRKLNVD